MLGLAFKCHDPAVPLVEVERDGEDPSQGQWLDWISFGTDHYIVGA